VRVLSWIGLHVVTNANGLAKNAEQEIAGQNISYEKITLQYNVHFFTTT